MRGKVLGYDNSSGNGMISGDDGKRYAFARTDLGAGITSLMPGREVDFDLAPDGHATAIFPIATPGALSGDKNKLVAALLAIFLGGLGIHKFYLGKKTAGIIMLVASLGGLILFAIPTLVVGVIAFIEGIIYIIKDEQKFHDDYVVGSREWF